MPNSLKNDLDDAIDALDSAKKKIEWNTGRGGVDRTSINKFVYRKIGELCLHISWIVKELRKDTNDGNLKKQATGVMKAADAMGQKSLDASEAWEIYGEDD